MGRCRRSRMNMDNDKKRETTAVDCGVILSGQEMPTADIALFSRLVFLTFSKTTFSDDEKRRYNELKLIEKRGLTHLTGGCSSTAISSAAITATCTTKPPPTSLWHS